MGCRILALAVVASLTAACTSAPPRATTGPSMPLPLTTPTSLPTSPSPSPSPSPSRTGPLTTGPNVRPGEKPPEFPDLARQHTANGALAFAIYYFKAFDWGYATNDPYLVAAISLPQCRACRIYVRSVRSLERSGRILRGGRITFNVASIFHGSVRLRADEVIDVSLNEEPVIIDSPAAPPSTAAARARNDHSLVFVSWVRGRWRIVEVTGQ